MVDPIGTARIGGVAGGRDLSVSRVAPVAPNTSVAARQPTQSAASLSKVAQALSVSAPVDVDRVAKVKKAIVDGKFPILPITIADRLIAFKLQWMSHEEA